MNSSSKTDIEDARKTQLKLDLEKIEKIYFALNSDDESDIQDLLNAKLIDEEMLKDKTALIRELENRFIGITNELRKPNAFFKLALAPIQETTKADEAMKNPTNHSLSLQKNNFTK